jgi:hypothetical protein
LYREPWRQQFHLTPERNWMNDPNGLIFPQDKRPTFEVFGDLADLGLESIELWSIHSIWP